MNRRIFSFITMIVLSLVLVGCGAIKNVNNSTYDVFNYVDKEVEGYYDFENCVYDEEMKDEEGTTRVNFYCDIDRIKNPSDEVKFVNKEIDAALNAAYDLGITTMKDDCAELAKNNDYFKDMAYGSEIQNNVLYNSKDILSIEFNAYEYWGGAHGTNAVYALMFDIPNQKQIMFSDVFNEDKLDILQEIISAKLIELNDAGEVDLFNDYYDSIDAVFNENAYNFYLTKDGVSFIFNQYLVAPYASGIFTVDIDYDELEGIVKFDLSRLQ